MAEIKRTGSQETFLDRMAHRLEMYEVVGLPAVHEAERRFLHPEGQGRRQS
jgi:hypothetical protein